MAYFTIDSDNHARAQAPKPDRAGPSGLVVFTSEAQLAALSSSWPNARFVQIWNSLSGVKPVQKFTNRQTAVRRIWNVLQNPDHFKAPKDERSTKTAKIIELLQQPTGATLKDLVTATGWQSHSIRGFISAQLVKRMGLRVKSLKRDGERVYQIHSGGKKEAGRKAK